MKTNEYRIGNYVSRDGNIMKVVAINERGLSLELVEKATGQQTNSGRTVPILLTEEWLVRLGFNKTGGTLELNDGIIELVFYKQLIFEIIEGQWKGFKHIKYIHQLQNLHYALKDKEITL
jgi:hypothetical protein